MASIVTFGCSHTVGAGLKDVYINNNHTGKVSRYAWPNIIANLSDRSLKNNAVNGASNKQIAYSILDYKFNKDDIIYVMWTFADRTCIIDKTVKLIGPWIDNDTNYAYYKYLHTVYDSMIAMQGYILMTKLYLESKNIKYKFLLYSNTNFIKNNWFNVDFVNIYFEEYIKYGLANDDHHLGIDAHKEFGQDIWDNTLNF